MGRVIRTASLSSQRRALMQGLASAFQVWLDHAKVPPAEPSRLRQYALDSLDEIWRSCETTTAAWEKRGYWVKADRFRRDWAWVPRLQAALMQGTGPELPAAAAEIWKERLSAHVQERLIRSRPWEPGQPQGAAPHPKQEA